MCVFRSCRHRPRRAQWKEQQTKAAKKNADTKAKYKQIKYQDLGEWQKQRDAKYPNKPGAGHTFSKVNKLNLAPASSKPRSAWGFGGK